MPTPHIMAQKGEIAKTVLMPGDPLRAKFIAENYLENIRCYNTVRNMLGFTGSYKGKEISVQGSGMGIPSIGIYSHELYTEYDVDNIIRIGTAGSIADKVELRDVVIAMSACTNSNYSAQFGLTGSYAPCASYELLENAVFQAKQLGIKYWVGNILSSDTFYDADPEYLKKWAKMNVLAVEMEAAGLYMNAARLQKNALAIMTISDCPLKSKFTTSEEREKSFTSMMEIALNI
ncbi:MAG: purine-nucleoside phosphorylase [Oscillospiraceae bacterium]|jgi:purine-nucleoside phosphorylase